MFQSRLHHPVVAGPHMGRRTRRRLFSTRPPCYHLFVSHLFVEQLGLPVDRREQVSCLSRTDPCRFEVRPQVLFDNQASGRFTVIEVNARDRPALLNRLAHALFASRLMVNSAHITQYGERAVDTFYVTDLLGGKVTSKDRLRQIEQALLEAAGEPAAVAA